MMKKVDTRRERERGGRSKQSHERKKETDSRMTRGKRRKERRRGESKMR